MMDRYRRRFVASTMGLITLVLICAIAVQYIILSRNAWDETKNTMSLVVGPWDQPGDGFRLMDPEKRSNHPDGEREGRGRSEFKDRDDRIAIENGEVITVFYDADTDTLSILDRSNEISDSTLIYDAVQEAADRADDFGLIKECGLIYYRESAGGTVKFAFADVSYIRARLQRSFFSLLLIFVLATGLFFLVSVWLSKRAVRPLEQAVEMERQFVADTSHDLKTPITVILANNSILRSEPDSRIGEQLQWLDSTDTAAKNMLQLIEQMLTLSALESVEQRMDRELISFTHAAEKSVLQLESVAYDRGIALEVNIEENIMIHGDKDYAERICSGLVENALKYEPAGGRVTVCLLKQKKKVLFRVENAGSVIAPEDLPHIFERFYRGDKTRNGIRGHGLGLPIIKQMTEMMGGEICAESSEGAGTVFAVEFAAEDA